MPRGKASKQPKRRRQKPNKPGRVAERAKPAPTGAASARPAAEGPGRRKGGAAPTPSKKVKVVMLPAARLRPNAWNPNALTDEQWAELREEVRRHGRTVKPVLVRPAADDAYEILDGEHNWTAAMEAGHATVPCEIVRADDFEARRLTFVRNQHGNRDPLRTGRLFQRMLELRGLSAESPAQSQRRFARENNISEGTLRNFLLYARAADVRNAYAPETGDATIAELSVARVRQYLELPEDRRDEWLDRGASSDEAAAILAEAGKKPKAPKNSAPAEAALPSVEGGGPDQPHAAGGEEAAPANADGDAERRPDRAAGGQGDEPGEPLSPAERALADGVLKAYAGGRAPSAARSSAAWGPTRTPSPSSGG